MTTPITHHPCGAFALGAEKKRSARAIALDDPMHSPWTPLVPQMLPSSIGSERKRERVVIRRRVIYGWALLSLVLVGVAQAPIFATLISLMPNLVGREHASNAIGYVVGAAGVGIALLPTMAGILAEQFTLEAIPPFILALTIILVGLFELLARNGSGFGSTAA